MLLMSWSVWCRPHVHSSLQLAKSRPYSPHISSVITGIYFFYLFFSTFLLTFVVFLLFYCSYAKEFIYTERLFFHSLSQFQILLAIVTSCGPQPAIFQTRFLVLHGTIIGTNNILFNAL